MDLDESRDTFISKFSEEPKRDDLTLLCLKHEDPSDQVPMLSLAEDIVEPHLGPLSYPILQEAFMHACF